MAKITRPAPLAEEPDTDTATLPSEEAADAGLAPEEFPFDTYRAQRWQDDLHEEEAKAQQAMERLVTELNQQIPPELLKQRPAYDGARTKLAYAEWHTIVRRLNRLIGHDRWATRVESLTSQGEDAKSRVPLHVSAVVTLTIVWPNGRANSFTNVGSAPVRCAVMRDSKTGQVLYDENGQKRRYPATWEAYDLAVKTSVHDGIKRCATALGDAFGLFLYDNDSYTMPEEAAETTAAPAAPTPFRKPRAEYPVATDDADDSAPDTGEEEVAHCEQCGKEIKGYTNAKTGKTYTTADLVGMSRRFSNGRILCYSCRNS